MKSRSLPTEYDDMAGLGSLPAGLFSFREESTVGNIAGMKKEMRPLWTITIKRPTYKGIVHSVESVNRLVYIRNM